MSKNFVLILALLQLSINLLCSPVKAEKVINVSVSATVLESLTFINKGDSLILETNGNYPPKCQFLHLSNRRTSIYSTLF